MIVILLIAIGAAALYAMDENSYGDKTMITLTGIDGSPIHINPAFVRSVLTYGPGGIASTVVLGDNLCGYNVKGSPEEVVAQLNTTTDIRTK